MEPNNPGSMPPYPGAPTRSQTPFAPNPYAQLNTPDRGPVKRRRSGLPWLLISLIFALLLLLVMTGLFVWAFIGRQDYKDNSDKKSAAAVQVAKQQEDALKEKEFLEKEKYPLKTYQGPANYGSVVVTYPKNWSAYISEANSGSPLVDGYFHPNVVPGFQSGTNYAFRIQVVAQQYADAVKQFDAGVKNGKLKVTPYSLPKMPNVSGSKVEGEIYKGQKNTMIVLPLRDKTIKVWTESEQFIVDLSNNILANMSFVP